MLPIGSPKFIAENRRKMSLWGKYEWSDKGKGNKGTKVMGRKGHPKAAKGWGGTSALVVNESDQSLFFNKDTQTLKCCFMWRGSGFRTRW